MNATGAARAQLSRWLGPAAVVLILFLALHVLRGELRPHGYHEIARTVRDIPLRQLIGAFGFTLLTYLVLPGYDAIALAYAGRTGERRVAPRRIGFGAMIAHGLSQTLGFPAITGYAVRYRLWSAWGVSSAEIVRAAAFAGVTFTLGIALVSGLALLLEPAEILARAHIPAVATRAVGTLLVAGVGVFLAWSFVRRGRAVRAPRWLAAHIDAVSGWEVPAPPPRFVLAQLGVALVDWSAAAAVLYTLLPDSASLGFVAFAGIFVLAQFVGLVSHVPGGLGVFETMVVLLLGPQLAADQTLAALLAYRAVYYLLPFSAALLALAVSEARARRAQLGSSPGANTANAAVVAARAGVVLARVTPAAVPFAASLATFGAGMVLLFSGATPSVSGRIATLERVLPHGVIEASHLLGSVAGAALLVLAWALRNRIGAAWGFSVALLAAGIVASLLKGLDWEEALLLALVLGVLLPFRNAFYRRSALTAEPFAPGWAFAILAVVGASVWLGMFSYRHVDYASDVWWRIHPHADAPRFLRASIVSAAALVMFGLSRLLRQAAVEPARPAPEALRRAASIVARAPGTIGHLALLGDKALLFDPGGNGNADTSSRTPSDAAMPAAGTVVSESEGFVQYSVAGRSWVALGDPIAVTGPSARAVRAELAWRFREEADRHGGWPVFYDVGTESLPLYIDLGLSFLKLGEQARVDLTAFSLEGRRKSLRRVTRDVERTGARFEVVSADRVPGILPMLRVVSDQWLANKSVREKGFSLGFFDEAYLGRFPVAVVRAAMADASGNDIVAFANVLPGGGHEELSVDLMRFAERAPRSVMDYLFVQLMLWGKAEGYRWFSLGMAPLAGLEARQLAPLWAKAGAWLYRHGEHFYNYRGLRQYKEKFDPVWEPRYLASPGGLALPRILANIASLISGGLTGVVRK